MSKRTDIKKSLIDVSDSVLIVIDMQDSFLTRYGSKVSKPVVEKAVWVIKLAQVLAVPIVAMAEDIDRSGNLNQSILDALAENITVHDKHSFGLAGQPKILAEIESTGRKTAILVGMETDVCVAQSALGLMEKGFQVAVLKDVVATTAGDEDIGIDRMRQAGAVISSAKAITYEWLRTVSNVDAAFDESTAGLEGLVPDCLEL